MTTRRVGIVGSRPPRATAPAADHDLFDDLLRDVSAFIDELPSGTVVVTGGADGVDTYAASYARGARHLEVVTYLPRDEDGAEKYFRRNQRIVDDSLELAAFVTPWARGTWDTVRRAKAKDLPIRIFRQPNPIPSKVTTYGQPSDNFVKIQDRIHLEPTGEGTDLVAVVKRTIIAKPAIENVQVSIRFEDPK